MNTGTMSEMVMRRSVLNHIKKTDKITEGGAAAGFDAALLDVREDDVFYVAEGYSDSSEFPMGFDIGCGADALNCLCLAYIRACNNIYAAGGIPGFISVRLVMGSGVREGYVRTLMNKLADEVAGDKVYIISGDTKISGALKPEHLTAEVTAYGFEEFECRKKGQKMIAGDHMLIIGYSGLYGAAVLKNKYSGALRESLPESYIERMNIGNTAQLSIKESARAAFEAGAKRVHDTSFGGIYAAVYQLAERAGLGVRVRHETVPVKQETIELSEALGINPYMLCGTGGLAAAFSEEEAGPAAEYIRAKTGLPVSDAGIFTGEKLRCVFSDSFRLNRVIEMPNGDEMFKVKI